jgi:DNA invertase Pin-like site-specific DNA recombinase
MATQEKEAMMATAIYKRVSSKQQDTKSQSEDLDAYRKRLEAEGEAVVEYADKFTGKTMNRPGWTKLWADACSGKVSKIAVWRLDRLGRTVAGLSHLFVELQERKIGLVSLRDGLDLNTPAGRLMAHVLASVAAYETEVRFERQVGGIAAVLKDLENGTAVWKKGDRAGTPRTKYGSGRKPGTRIKVTEETEEAILGMADAGKPVAAIARLVKVSRVTIYTVLKRHRTAKQLEGAAC